MKHIRLIVNNGPVVAARKPATPTQPALSERTQQLVQDFAALEEFAPERADHFAQLVRNLALASKAQAAGL